MVRNPDELHDPNLINHKKGANIFINNIKLNIMYTLYKDLSPEQQTKELKEFDKKYHIDIKDNKLCILCGMALHNCLCSHDN